MSKRSGPEPPAPAGRRRRDLSGARERLLRMAGAVADGAPLAWSGSEDDRVSAGLRLIAGLSERLGAVAYRTPGAPPHQVLFQWGHLDVLERIGTGASSEVFRAYDPLLAIEVALKLSRPGMGWAGAGEWIAEARRLARIRHPNIVSVYGVDRHDGRAGLWLDLVDGETLEEWGRRRGALPGRELCLVGIELCRGLGAIHEAGLLHCDLKPANLLRSHDGRILIADFGAAASAQANAADTHRRGTPLAMAPEVLQGGEAGTRSDLYGLGVVLYWLASGHMPVRADSIEELREVHRHTDVQGLREAMPDGLPAAVRDLVISLLAPLPEHRPSDAGEVERLLAAALASAAVASIPATASGSPAFERLYGREAELAYLQQEYRRALGGQALPVLLAGESGTGKSALASSFGDWLAGIGGRLQRVVAGVEPGGARLWTQIARLAALTRLSSRRVRPDDPAGLAGALAAVGPMALCLDDLHRLDDAERAWLPRFVAALRGSQVLVLGLLRVGEVRDARAASLFGDAPAALLRLRAFTPEQTEAMLAELLELSGRVRELPAGLATELHRLSGGNPFFLSELLRHLLASGGLIVEPEYGWRWRPAPDALPPSLELTALQRCRGLPGSAQAALDAAAVLGEAADATALASVLELDAGHLESVLAPVLAAELLEPCASGGWRFRHGVIRRAVYGAMTPERRRELHRRCAQRLADAASMRDLAALSVHAERADDIETAYRAGYAALTAREREEPTELAAWERLQSLLDAGVSASAAQRWRVVLGRSTGLRMQGRLVEAQALAEQVQLSLSPRPGSREDEALRLERAQIWFALGQYRQVLDELTTGARSTWSARTRKQAAQQLVVRAQAALGEYRLAETSLTEALEGGSGTREQTLQQQTLYGWCVALQGRLDEADRALERALHMARSAPAVIRADILRRLHWVRLGRGRYQSAHALALAAHDAYRGIGDAIGQAKTRMALAQVRLSQGLTEEAMGYLNRAGHELEDIGDRHCEAETRWLLARALTELGDFERADAQLDLALDLIVRIGDRDDEFRFLTERARLRLAQGRADQAAEAAAEAARIAGELNSRDGLALAQIEQAAVDLASGNVSSALERADTATATLGELGSGERWRGLWLLGRCQLVSSRDTRQSAAAVPLLAAAQDVIDRIVGEFDRRDQARRLRLRQSWQPLVDDHARALVAAGRDEDAERLRRRWSRLGPADQEPLPR